MRKITLVTISIFLVLSIFVIDLNNKFFQASYPDENKDSLGVRTSIVPTIELSDPYGEFIDPTESPTPFPTASIVENPHIATTPASTLVITVSPTKAPIATPKPTATAKPTNTPTSIPTATPSPTFDYSKPWPVASGCPVTTQNCVPCTSGWACRYEPGQTHGFKGWSCQNNNPGNIRNSSTNMTIDFKNKIIVRNGGVAACGVRYDSRGGSYFVFSSYTAGMNSLKAYIKGIANGEHGSYANCGDCSIAYFFSKYAPGDSGYATYVANYIGEPTTQTLNFVVENKLNGFAEAIKKHEGFFVQ